MKELLTSFKFWLTASIIILITLIAICISFAGNYNELEALRQKDMDNTEQLKLINSLTSENESLKRKATSSDSLDQIDTVIREFIRDYFNTDGTESENEKALRVRKYVTDDLYKKMYDENEKPESTSPTEKIVTSCLVNDIVYQSKGSDSAEAYVETKMKYNYPDGSQDSYELLFQVQMSYDRSEMLWKISDASSSKTNLKKVWG